MARLSVASSAVKGNGHAPAPQDAASGRSLREYTDKDFDSDDQQYETKSRILPLDPSLLPRGSRSLSLIALQAFFLGLTLAGSLLSTAWLVSERRTIWRLPSFFACLALFHFLEFWTTAHFNLPAARASSFLLYSNGTAYNIAHTLATIEIIVSNFITSYQSLYVNHFTVVVGLTLIVLGQVVRSVAMAQAGTNFNHTPQRVRKEGHELVTTGVYGWLRHPSYFGFFWWALGTQVLVGNKICTVGYLLALWNFFNRRILGMYWNTAACAI